jgi:hypothetical protein
MDKAFEQFGHGFVVQGIVSIRGLVIIGISIKCCIGNHDCRITFFPEIIIALRII